jgi:quinol monooxygenase YgiN
MKAVIVSYTVKAEFAEANAENIKAVMADVKALNNASVRYQAFRLADDPCSFRHIGYYADDAAVEAMTSLPSFKHFQQQLKASGPTTPPHPQWLELVGAGHDLF